MAYIAAASEAGTRKQVNEDSCCIKVAETSLGEVVMALVCDGVGGLSAGNLASTTVVNRFSLWFEQELPALMEGMLDEGTFDFSLVKAVWGAMLSALNELIRTHGSATGSRLGTTFTGIITCGGRYLVGHVGDCRAFRMDGTTFEQITEDQTVVAKKLAAGEITAEEAKNMPQNVILQSVGTGRSVVPAFYEGSCTDADLFVICCDGAYHRVENEGIRRMFQRLSRTDVAAMDKTCREMLELDMSMGEKDNLTVVCFSTILAPGGAIQLAQPAASASLPEDELSTMVDDEDEGPVTMVADDGEDEGPVTMVADEGEDEDDLATQVEPEDEDDLATQVEDEDEDDLATQVEDEDEDDLATQVEPEDEDDLATQVEPEDEDDLATQVADGEDEDDLATQVADDEDEDDLATQVADDDDDWDDDDEDWGDDPFGDDDFDFPDFDRPDDDDDEDEEEDAAWATDFEDEAPTMVADEDDDDSLPTMVEGADA